MPELWSYESYQIINPRPVWCWQLFSNEKGGQDFCLKCGCPFAHVRCHIFAIREDVKIDLINGSEGSYFLLKDIRRWIPSWHLSCDFMKYEWTTSTCIMAFHVFVTYPLRPRHDRIEYFTLSFKRTVSEGLFIFARSHVPFRRGNYWCGSI